VELAGFGSLVVPETKQDESWRGYRERVSDGKRYLVIMKEREKRSSKNHAGSSNKFQVFPSI
jgi:hypothetical protein